MPDNLITFSAEPALTRRVYLKMALFILGIVTLLHTSGQWRTPPLIDYRISLVVCLLLGLLALYGLTRTPLTQRLIIDYDRQKIVIEYLTLTQSANQLELPFEHLQVKMDTSFGITGNGAKWKAILLLDGQEQYSVFDREEGFSTAQLTAFVEQIQRCTNQ